MRPRPSVLLLPEVLPASFDGAPQAAVAAIEAAAPRARTWVQRMYCSLVCESRAKCRELVIGTGDSSYRRVLGSKASRTESPSRLSASTSSETPMTGGQR